MTSVGQSLHRESSAVPYPPRRTKRRVLWGLLVLSVVCAGVVIGRRAVSRSESGCAKAFRTDASGAAVIVCQREYEQTGDPDTGILLANALRQSDELVAADALARDLVTTKVRGDALQVRGRIALAETHTEDAIKLLQEARTAHRARKDHGGLASDSQVLAEIETDRERFAESLLLLEDCITEARVAGDSRTEALCHVTAARTLMGVGYFEAAKAELDRAASLVSDERALAGVWRWRGNLEQEVVRSPAHHAHLLEAVAALERSYDLAVHSKRTGYLGNIHMSLAYALAELGRADEAARHLEEAGVLDPKGTFAIQRAQLAARIAYHRKNYPLALAMNKEVYDRTTDPDEQIEICVIQARIALAMNDLSSAVEWAERGVERVEAVRAAQTVTELRPWVLATRREPLELLFTAHVRAARTSASAHITAAFAVFDQWQGRTMLDNLARLSQDASPGLSSRATRLQSLMRWLPVLSHAPLMTSDAGPALQVLNDIDLVALAVAEGEVWRMTSSHGHPVIDSLGPYEALDARFKQFITSPTDPALAAELGALIVPDAVAGKTDEPLYVVLDTPVAALPIAALRKGSTPLIALRPVIRAPRLPVRGACTPPGAGHGSLVLADAFGDLFDARRESATVGSLLGTTPLVGSNATSAALFGARPGSVVHLAVHGDVDDGGGILRLYDRVVSALEIAATRLGLSLVVMSACSSSRSSDPELAGSLSTAFLAAGSPIVVATLRPVFDSGAYEVMTRFYRARGVDDPVHALARVQGELARTANKDWPNFAVFSTQVCAAHP